MSDVTVRIQDAFANCCQGVSEFASSASESIGTFANWFGRTVTTIAEQGMEIAYSAVGVIQSGAHKVAQFVQPYFEQLQNFASENQESLIIAAIALTVGAVATYAINAIFCKSTQPVAVPVPAAV